MITLPDALQLLNLLLIPAAVFLARMDKSQALTAQALTSLSEQFAAHIGEDSKALSAIHRRLDQLKAPPGGAE